MRVLLAVCLIACLTVAVGAVPELIADYAERTATVSSSGRIRIDNYFELTAGGKDTGKLFSRLDYGRDVAVQQTTIPGLTLILPTGTTNIKYCDRIGNISTSALTVHEGSARSPAGSMELTLYFRYPLMTGWHVNFNVSYDLPSELMATDGDQHVLNLMATDRTIPDPKFTKYVSSYILPARAAIPSVVAPLPKKTTTTVPAFADWVDRTKVSFEAEGVTGTDLAVPVSITYSLGTVDVARHYLGLAGIVAAVVVIVAVIRRLW